MKTFVHDFDCFVHRNMDLNPLSQVVVSSGSAIIESKTNVQSKHSNTTQWLSMLICHPGCHSSMVDRVSHDQVIPISDVQTT